MPRSKKQPYIFLRPQSRNYYAYLNRKKWAVALGTDDPVVAQSKLADIVAYGIPGDDNIADIGDTVINRARVNNTPATYNGYTGFANIALNTLSALKVNKIKHLTKDTIEKYKAIRMSSLIASPKSTNPATSINRELTMITKIAEIAVEKGAIHPKVIDIIRQSRLKEVHNHNAKLPTPAEISRIISYLPAKYKPLILLILGTGIRYQEALHIDTGDIRPGKIIISRKNKGTCDCHILGFVPKNNQIRSIPATDGTIIAANEWINNRAGVNISNAKINYILKKACEKAKLSKITIHDLRRIYASQMIIAGVGIAVVSKLLGHSSIRTTEIYLRLDLSDMVDTSTHFAWLPATA